MRHASMSIFLIVMISMCTGCAVGQKIHISQQQQNVQKVHDVYDIAIQVIDARPYVKSGKKDKSFIGIYRAGFGNPWDVNTAHKEALEDILLRDISSQLRAAGFLITHDSPQRQIIVEVLDYNFDCYANCRVWHKFTVRVKDSQGKTVAESDIFKENVVQGSAWTGPKASMEEQMPQIYANLLPTLILQNEKIMAALRKEKQ